MVANSCYEQQARDFQLSRIYLELFAISAVLGFENYQLALEIQSQGQGVRSGKLSLPMLAKPDTSPRPTKSTQPLGLQVVLMIILGFVIRFQRGDFGGYGAASGTLEGCLIRHARLVGNGQLFLLLV